MNELLVEIVRVVIVTAILALVFRFANRRMSAYFETRPHLRFRQQLFQIGGLLIAVLVVILFMPEDLRGDLLSLYGLILSATIALSSTTLVGNVLAGITLKIIGNCRPGNYITVGEYFGRITEMDLLHTEIQTEERDLTTLPNMYLVTNPVRVMRSSGTLLFVELSLGYDLPRREIEKLLKQAAIDTGLDRPFVQIRNLGDYSVTYRINGLLTEVNRLLDKRRELRARTMDALHAADIEIVSPTFMNTRAFDADDMFVADVATTGEGEGFDTVPDTVVFDKAEMAESVEKLRATLEETQAMLKECEKRIDNPESYAAQHAAIDEKQELEERAERLRSIIDRKEAKISNK